MAHYMTVLGAVLRDILLLEGWTQHPKGGDAVVMSKKGFTAKSFKINQPILASQVRNICESAKISAKQFEARLAQVGSAIPTPAPRSNN